MEKGFLKGQSDNLPKIDIYTVMEFFTSNSSYFGAEIKGIKLLKTARESYKDDVIEYVQVKREGTKCTVKCRVKSYHKVKSMLCHCTLVCDENEEKVESVTCHNCHAITGGCEHIVSFLVWLFKKSEDPATTSVKCYWTKPPLPKVGSDIKFIKAKDFKNEELPVPREDPDFLNTLINEYTKRNIHNSQIMTYYMDITTEMKVSIHYLICKYRSVNNHLTVDDFITFCKNNISEEQCVLIEKETRNQIATSLWYELLYGRIMASLVHKASTSKTTYFCGVLLETILGAYQFKEQIDIQRGKRLKDQVKAQVENIKNIKIKKCGLFLSKDYPTLATSPYGLTEEHVIEIKCPQQNKLMTKYITSTNLTPEYEAQVQLQMHFANRKKSFFCIAHDDFEISKQVDVYEVFYNEEYCRNLIRACTLFWEHVFDALMESSLNKLEIA